MPRTDASSIRPASAVMQTDAAMPTPSAPTSGHASRPATAAAVTMPAASRSTPYSTHRVRATPNTTGSVATPTAASASTSRTFGSSASTNDRKRKYAKTTGTVGPADDPANDWEEREGGRPPRRDDDRIDDEHVLQARDVAAPAVGDRRADSAGDPVVGGDAREGCTDGAAEVR